MATTDGESNDNANQGAITKDTTTDVEPESRDNEYATINAPDLEGQFAGAVSRFRPRENQDRPFASTLTSLLVAISPIANVFSIAALVTSWRAEYTASGTDASAKTFPDPRWCTALNASSLAAAFLGTFTLLFMLVVKSIRYIVGMPMVLLLWLMATGLLIGDVVSTDIYVPPIRPQQTYSQGFWYAVIAAALYFLASMILVIDMRGYFLGHYPESLRLTKNQRWLILQALLLSFWLAVWAAAFSQVCDFSYVDALYFCDITLLTVGFGGLSPPNSAARGMVIPFATGGIILLGLTIKRISALLAEMAELKLVKQTVQRKREPVVGPRVLTPLSRLHLEPHRQVKILKRPKLLIMREEEDRFNAMQQIQQDASKFKKWWILCQSLITFSLLWCVGAVVFWKVEMREQHLTYFEALYFCFVSLLTIGSGAFYPKSNAGKPFFVIWSLIGIPVMTVFLSNLAEAVLVLTMPAGAIGRWVMTLGDGRLRQITDKHPRAWSWIVKKAESTAAERPIKSGIPVGRQESSKEHHVPTIEELASEDPSDYDLALQIPVAITRTASDLATSLPKRYSYDEWARFTRLIHFTRGKHSVLDQEEDISEWDWIGENSPMLSDRTQAEFVLNRLCESMTRYIRWQRSLSVCAITK